MRYFTKYFTLALLVVSVFFLQSCLSDNDDYNPMVIGTTKIVDNEASITYFMLDSGYKLTPNNLEGVDAQKLENNQRVFLQLKDVDEDEAKKELKATIILLVKIETKDIEFTESAETAKQLLDASDPVNIGDAYIANGYLTLRYNYKGEYKNDKHTFSLYAIKDESSSKDGAYQLYLTHDEGGDNGQVMNTKIMSFPIESIKEELNQNDKAEIIFKTYYSGNMKYSIYFNKKK